MKKSSFYLTGGILAIILILLLYLFIQIRMPLLILAAILITIIILAIVKHRIGNITMDERQVLIDMKAASLTMKISAILLLIGNVILVVYAFSVPPMIMPMPHFQPPEMIALQNVGIIAIAELLLMAACLIIYGIVHIQYTKKFGGDIEETDNEE